MLNACVAKVLLIFGLSLSRVSGKEPIYFNADGTFKITTFTDLHFGEGSGTDWGPSQDVKSTKVMTDILEWEHPNFIVFTGDILSGQVMFPNASETVDQLLQPAVKGNYRWASTYGNHDVGNNVTFEDILEAEQKYNLSYTQQGEGGLVGTTNFYVPIYPANVIGNESEGAPALILWFFDRRGEHNSTLAETHGHEIAADWFTKEAKKLIQTWGPIPSLAFFHYPTVEYKWIQKTIAEHPECPGLAHEKVTFPEKGTEFMNALINSGIVRGTFVGHNHGDGWCCNYKTLSLCFNRHTGYGGNWGELMRGSRVITLHKDDLWGPISSYVRLENGTVTDQFPIPKRTN